MVLPNRITVPLTNVDPYELKYPLPDVSSVCWCLMSIITLTSSAPFGCLATLKDLFLPSLKIAQLSWRKVIVMYRVRNRGVNSGEHEERLNSFFFILLWTLFPFLREFFELKFWRLKIWSRRILEFLRKALLIHTPFSVVCQSAISLPPSFTCICRC